MLEIYNLGERMKNYKLQFTISGLLLVSFTGLSIWFIRHEPQATLKIIISLLIIVSSSIALAVNFLKRKEDVALGQPEFDELSAQIKLHAGSKAFLTSLYLWLVIFMLNDSFTNNEEMLGIGILGASAIYGLYYWYYKSTGNFSDAK
jgi:hypothetical protein